MAGRWFHLYSPLLPCRFPLQLISPIKQAYRNHRTLCYGSPRTSPPVSFGLHRSTQEIICKNKNKTKQNKKYFGRILWKYIKLQVDKRHDLFLKKKMDGDRHFRLVPSLPPSTSNIELRRTKKMFGCFSLWKKKNGTKKVRQNWQMVTTKATKI